MNHPPRALKCRLTSRDQIYFLHIPKTGGSTFMNILENIVGRENYISADRLRIVKQHNPYFFANYRIVRGHFNYTIYEYTLRRPLFITMLRHPLDRIISQFKHLKRDKVIPSEMILSEFLHSSLNRRTNNKQIQWISGVNKNYKEPIEMLLEVAKIRLDDFAFFGILEKFNDSLDLMAYTFDWEPITQYELHNQAPPAKIEIDAETRQMINDLNQADIEFYNYANMLFDERIAQMRAELAAKQA